MKRLYKPATLTILTIVGASLSSIGQIMISSNAVYLSKTEVISNEEFSGPSLRQYDDSYDPTTAHCSFAGNSAPSDEAFLNSHGIDYRDGGKSLNMMECADGNNIIVPQVAISTLIRPKYIAMSKVLTLSNQEAEAFFPIYARYEAALNKLSNETPDLETLRSKQQLLKETYFEEMTKKSGPYLASRFLTWEDYYSTTCKAY